MSQGTMNREPKYEGGAHPKYGSCRGLVSLIPRACISRCPYEVPVVRRRRSSKVVIFLIPSHGFIWFGSWYTWLSDGIRIFAALYSMEL
jgi:hypothetical protein